MDMKKAYGDIHYLSIRTLKEIFKDTAHEHVSQDIDLERVVQDYIFLCFFGGNDFIPHLPCSEIRFKGLDKLLELYWTHLQDNHGYLTHEGKIEWTSFTAYMKELSLHEDDMIQATGRQMKSWKPKQNFPNEEAKEAYMKELLYPVHDPVNFSSPGWWTRYYKHCFHMNYVDKREVQEICHEYLKIMEWNLAYYMKGCPDWEYYYPYPYAPFAKDILQAMSHYKSVVFPCNKACTPFEQLMLVLPPSSKKLLPKRIYELMEEDRMLPYYPEAVVPNTMFCNMTWQCKPQLPRLNYELVQRRVSEQLPKLSETQQKMNAVRDV